MQSARRTGNDFLEEYRIVKKPEPGYPGSGWLSHFFQVDADVIGDPAVPLRVLIELFLAPVAAEVIFLIFIGTGELCIFFIEDHQADWIGWHYVLPR
jgi:hypothetical protein